MIIADYADCSGRAVGHSDPGFRRRGRFHEVEHLRSAYQAFNVVRRSASAPFRTLHRGDRRSLYRRAIRSSTDLLLCHRTIQVRDFDPHYILSR